MSAGTTAPTIRETTTDEAPEAPPWGAASPPREGERRLWSDGLIAAPLLPSAAMAEVSPAGGTGSGAERGSGGGPSEDPGPSAATAVISVDGTDGTALASAWAAGSGTRQRRFSTPTPSGSGGGGANTQQKRGPLTAAAARRFFNFGLSGMGARQRRPAAAPPQPPQRRPSSSGSRDEEAGSRRSIRSHDAALLSPSRNPPAGAASPPAPGQQLQAGGAPPSPIIPAASGARLPQQQQQHPAGGDRDVSWSTDAPGLRFPQAPRFPPGWGPSAPCAAGAGKHGPAPSSIINFSPSFSGAATPANTVRTSDAGEHQET